MSDEHDSWFKAAFGVDLGQVVQRIGDEGSAVAGQVASTVTQVVQGVQGAVEGAIDDVTGAATGIVKKVAGAVSPSGGGGGGSSGGGGRGSFPLGGSVGRGGKNASNDVRAVQTALGITADGQCGGQTIAAIEAYQRNMGQSKPDGRVDAGGATERALAGGGGVKPAQNLADKAIQGAQGLLDDATQLGGELVGAVTSIDPKSLRMAVDGPDDGSSGAASADFRQGYNDGRSGRDANPGPRAGDAVAEYQDGYQKGRREFDSESPSGPQSSDFKQGYADGVKGVPARPGPRAGGALIDYNEGYERGRIEFQSKAQLRSASGVHYKQGYIDGLKGSDPSPGSRSGDALDDYNQGYDVGHKEFLEKSPRTDDGEITDTVVDIAKSKGLVAAGERAGKAIGTKAAEKAVGEATKKAVIGTARKAGGIIGLAIDFATSPGGDVKLPHVIYQAVISTDKAGFGIPVPGALWHRKRENAERDARNYTLQTGEATDIEEQYSKDDDDPE